jgi:hypothetical protein
MFVIPRRKKLPKQRLPIGLTSNTIRKADDRKTHEQMANKTLSQKTRFSHKATRPAGFLCFHESPREKLAILPLHPNTDIEIIPEDMHDLSVKFLDVVINI